MHDVGNCNMGRSATKSQGISQCLESGHPVSRFPGFQGKIALGPVKTWS